MLPITSTRQPRPAFFRDRRSRTLSSSSFSGEAESSQSESSSSDDDPTDFDDAFEARVSSRYQSDHSRRSLSISPGPASPLSTTRRSVSGGVPPSFGNPSKRQHLKLSLSLLRIRQSLAALARPDAPSPNCEALTASLKALAASLPADLGTLGPFLPILARLAKDLVEEFKSDARGREGRRSLSKEEAKRLVGLRQRWCAGDSGKGKGRERDGGDADWVPEILEHVDKNAPPEFLQGPYDRPTAALLNGLEALLLPSALPRIGLSELGLSAEYLNEWEIFERAPDVLSWYLSFESVTGDDEARGVRARQLLSSVRSLDLSKNRLDCLPNYLPTLFGGLETLSLAHNVFQHLPPCLTAFSSLRRLKTHGNRLTKSHRGVGTRSNTKDAVALVREKRSAGSDPAPREVVQALVDICAQVLRSHLGLPYPRSSPPLHSPSTSSSSTPDEPESDSESTTSTSTVDPRQTNGEDLLATLPPHLHALLMTSYTCDSCQRFVSAGSSSHLPDIFERVNHLDPGVALPTQLIGARPSPGSTSPPFASIRSSPLVHHPIDRPTSPDLIPRPPLHSRSSSTSSVQSTASTTSLSNPLLSSPSSPLSTSSSFPSRPPSPQIPIPNRAMIPPPPHLLTLEQRVLLALIGRGTDLTAFVLGPSRLCLACAGVHLGVVAEGGSGGGGNSGECRCGMCGEEKRVRSNGSGGVMRWLRRRNGRSELG